MFHLRILKSQDALAGKDRLGPPASTVRPVMRSRLDKPYGLGEQNPNPFLVPESPEG